MSTKAVIVWLVLALVLGVAAIFLLRPSSNSWSESSIPIGDKIAQFSPGQIIKIVVERSGASAREVIEKPPGGKGTLGADADWQLRLEAVDSSTKPSTPWPIESARMHGLLRMLSETRAVALPPDDSKLGATTKVSFYVGDDRWSWLLAERTLAGTGMVQLEPHQNAPARRAIVAKEVIEAFADPGAWRDHFPAAGIAPDASRIRLMTGKSNLLLGKSEGKWAVREPVGAPADPVAIQRLLSDIARIRIADFPQTPPPASAGGLEKPTATLTIEADRRAVAPGSTEPTVSTDTLTVTIGGAADASATRLYASVNGSHAVLLEYRSLAGVISMEPGTYIWPHPSHIAAPDVSVIALRLIDPLPTATGAKTFERTAVKWARVLPGETNAMLPDKDARQVDALLAFLTGGEKPSGAGQSSGAANSQRPAITIAAPDPFRVIASIELSSSSGQSLETIELGWISSDVCSLHTGTVYRAYPISQLPSLLVDLIAGSKTEPSTAPAPVAPK